MPVIAFASPILLLHSLAFAGAGVRANSGKTKAIVILAITGAGLAYFAVMSILLIVASTF